MQEADLYEALGEGGGEASERNLLLARLKKETESVLLRELPGHKCRRRGIDARLTPDSPPDLLMQREKA